MKILHTSDWHLGRQLYGQSRYEEFEAFLDWILETIETEVIDVLLIAGDVFDTTSPSNRAQKLYYNFLCRLPRTSCRHVVIIGGNHDSPSFLNAPKELLRFLNIHILGQADEPKKEVIELQNPDLIVCAVPYLRDRDVRSAKTPQNPAEKQESLIQGIHQHYEDVFAYAQSIQKKRPVIAMGHLFTAGGQTIEGDGVRDLYVGNLAHVGSRLFADWISYTALGHLHLPQKVGGRDHVRYSGSPLPMGFGEANQQKLVILVELDSETRIREIPIPVFQKLLSLKGDREILLEAIKSLSPEEPVWLEIVHTGPENSLELQEELLELIQPDIQKILRFKVKKPRNSGLLFQKHESLEDLQHEEVFRRCLKAHEIPEAEYEELLQAFQMTLDSLDSSKEDQN